MPRTVTFEFTPNPGPQTFAMQAYADEILYGGAAGGGKSAWARAEHVRLALTVPGSRSLILRRTYPMLKKDVIPKLIAEIPRQIAKFNKTDNEWTFVNGSVLELGYLLNDEAVANFQSPEYQLVTFEEGTQFTEHMFTYLKSRLRAANKVGEAMERQGLRPRMLMTANPGGIGHAWVKSRFIDLAPPKTLFSVAPPPPQEGDPPMEEAPQTRIYIPAKVGDNPKVDRNYIRQLNELDPDTRRALRDGDWDSYTGQRFKAWRADTHVITVEQARQLMPAVGGVRALGVDYGMDAPFCGMWAYLGPDGLVIFYREVYKAGLTPKEQAQLLADSELPGERESGRRIPVALDPSTWARNAHKVEGRPPSKSLAPPVGSIADPYFRQFGSALEKANNDRLAGVALFADKLRVRGDGMPRLLVVGETCPNFVRTFPALIRDVRNPEDVDTHGEDHAYDAGRYVLMEIDGKHRNRDHRGPNPTGLAVRHTVRDVPAFRS